VEVRRALLLFAIVLGLAAVVTSLSRSTPSQQDTAPSAPPSRPSARPAASPARAQRIIFDATRGPETKRLSVGQAASVSVRVDLSATVQLEGLGLTATAERLTPARFDVLASEPGRHAVRIASASGANERTVGHLVIRRRP